MSQNMQIVFNNRGTLGTYVFADNPSDYAHIVKDVTERGRSLKQKLTSYNFGDFHYFELNFDFVGTAQYANFGTIWGLHKSIDFYAFDEVRGTTEQFTVAWTNQFEFKLREKYWDGGFTGRIILEQV